VATTSAPGHRQHVLTMSRRRGLLRPPCRPLAVTPYLGSARSGDRAPAQARDGSLIPAGRLHR
jgi:hypothetical protein